MKAARAMPSNTARPPRNAGLRSGLSVTAPKMASSEPLPSRLHGRKISAATKEAAPAVIAER